MRYVRTTAAAVLTTAMLATACTTTDTGTHTDTLPASCERMQGVPAYSILFEDMTRSHIKAGAVQVKAAVKSSEGDRSALKAQCDMIYKQFRGDLAMLDRN